MGISDTPAVHRSSAPKKLTPPLKARWLYLYAPEALMHLESGQMTVPSAEIKEQLHCLLANGWRAGVARLLLYLVVTSLRLTPTTSLPLSLRTSTLQRVGQHLAQLPPRVGPGGWPRYPSSIPPADEMWHHWEHSARAVHPLQHPTVLSVRPSRVARLRGAW